MLRFFGCFAHPWLYGYMAILENGGIVVETGGRPDRGINIMQTDNIGGVEWSDIKEM